MIPGMLTTRPIKTGKKTIMPYLLRPLNRAKEAFRECASASPSAAIERRAQTGSGQRELSFSRIVSISALFALISSAAHSKSLPDEMLRTELKVLRDFAHLAQSERVIVSHCQLQNLFRTALDNSPVMGEARLSIDAANGDIACGALLPQVSATEQSRYSSTATVSSNRLLGNPDVAVSATMPVYDWIKIDARIKGRESASASTGACDQLQSQQVAVEVTSLCHGLTKQRAGNQEYLSNVQKLVDMLVKVTNAEPGRSGEQLQARSRLLQAESTREITRSKVRKIRIRLERLVSGDSSLRCEGIGSHHLMQPDLGAIRAAIQHPRLVTLESDYQQQRRALDQISASRKPQVQLGASYGPVTLGVTSAYANVMSLSITAPLYDGNILRPNERAALERANATTEKMEQTRRQIDAVCSARYAKASSDLRRAEDYDSLLEVNYQVGKDFFLQWTALWRRSLFELMAIEAKQFSLQSGDVTALFDGIEGYAVVLGNAGLIAANRNVSDVGQ
jgi:adhesin transport system outer membrane protein